MTMRSVALALFILLGAAGALAAPGAGGSAAVPWAALSPARQQVLKPLAAEWDTLPAKTRRHFAALADRYPSMKPEKRALIDRRLPQWARLTKEQRIEARNNYRKIQQLPPDQRRLAKAALKEAHARKLAARGGAQPGAAMQPSAGATTPAPTPSAVPALATPSPSVPANH